jgi:hypothetical protein
MADAPPAAREIQRTNNVCSSKTCSNILTPGLPWKTCEKCRLRDRVRYNRTSRDKAKPASEETGDEVDGDVIPHKADVISPVNGAQSVSVVTPAKVSSKESPQLSMNLSMPEDVAPAVYFIPVKYHFAGR